MTYATVAESVKALVRSRPEHSDFVYAFLEAYGTPQANITRLKSGTMNLAKAEGELLFKKKLYFKPTDGDVFATLDGLKAAKGTKSNDPRFLLVTDFERLVALDRKTSDTLDCKLSDLDSHFDFFLPLAGMEKTKLSNENPADIKAAERMAKLFDAIRAHNPDFVEQNSHAMNVFLARLLFCFFAEDTGIFPDNAMSNAIASHTAADASDLHDFFVRLFDLLDRKSRAGLPKHLRVFPYVNGGLFKDHFPIPEFSMKARRMMIEAGKLTWADINPDIFGSMFQAVIDPEERHNLGQHYTSVTNIMKVIEPLFLNDFREAFEKACALQRGKSQALHRLLERIAHVKIFDPACGSGNFLIIAYKELRRLEMDVFSELQKETGELPLSGLKVSQFYGIEISDFAAETAVLALWLTEHQMNLESKRVCGQAPDNLPLRDGAHIVCDNACRVPWETVCPKEDGDEIYILGNPPYLGARQQNKVQKSDMLHVFGKVKGLNSLDYISCWFHKASLYIKFINSTFAFVSTNSLTQGEQVSLLWPRLLGEDLEIVFCHTSFKWQNNSSNNAGVICVIIGVRNRSDKPYTIYSKGLFRVAAHINAYLSDAPDTYIDSRHLPLSRIPRIRYGSFALDDGRLTLSQEERDSLLHNLPEVDEYVKPFIGARELIQGAKRYCLWLLNAPKHIIESELVYARVQHVHQWRLNSDREATRKLSSKPHVFAEIRQPNSPYIAFPTVSSERRNYIPVGFVDNNTIASNQIYIVADAPTSLFAIIASRMHMTWVRAVGGRLKSDYRYSAAVCYNTFPVPKLSEAQKQALTAHVMEVLQARENHPEKTMAQLYDPDKMPADLRAAHAALDLAVDQLYRKQAFTSDEERLEHLFKRYEAMIAAEKEGKK